MSSVRLVAGKIVLRQRIRTAHQMPDGQGRRGIGGEEIRGRSAAESSLGGSGGRAQQSAQIAADVVLGVTVKTVAPQQVAQAYEKQLARLHAREFPEWKQHSYPASVQPADAGLVLNPGDIHLIDQLPDEDGLLTCTLPEGSWTVLSLGMTSTGKTNIPAPPEATGLECDKLSRKHTRRHLESMITPAFAQLSKEQRSVIKTIVADSYEAGTQNWTDDFEAILQQRLGYDPLPFLPTFTGRVVASAEASDRFLADLRRTEELFPHGVNHAVMHVVVHQPQEGVPGRNPWFGIQFHRNTPWFLSSRSWIKHHQRMHTLLQYGRPAADVAVYYGDFTPVTVRPENPVPHGYDFDYINSDILLHHLAYRNGRWVIELLGASSYRALIIPDTGDVRPAVAARTAELKKSGGPVLDALPATDARLREAGIDPVFWDANQAFRWKLRRLDDGGAVFLLCNFEKTRTFEVNLRVDGLQPERFQTVTGGINDLATWHSIAGGTRVRFMVNDFADGFFLVFRKAAITPSVRKFDGGLDLWFDKQGKLSAGDGPDGTWPVLMSDGTSKLRGTTSFPSHLNLKGESDTG